MQSFPRVEPSSSGDLVALATPPPGAREATRRSTEHGDEATLLDMVELPDNEATTIWPMLAAPVADVVDVARGSGERVPRRKQIGKYELREKLARGAFGVVFSARDPSLDRDVAIKVLRPNHLTNQVIVQRFLHEARATARIGHPGIVTIHDCGQIETNLGETAFIAMELLAGQSLADRLADTGALAPDAAIEIVRQIASALEAAHLADVLHRDLKPDNVFLVADPAMPSGERVKVLDFGLAKLGDRGHTQLDTVFGTPHYMSPEQTRSTAQVDHRSDIYALGCILFELITGQPPFDGELRAVIERHQRTTPPRAASLVADLAPGLDDLIAAMLDKDPMARPQTMGGVQRELWRITGRAPTQPPARPSQPAAHPTPGYGHPAPHGLLAPAPQGTLHSHPHAAAHEPTITYVPAPPVHMAPLLYGRPPTPNPVLAASSGPHAQLDPAYSPFTGAPSGVLLVPPSGARPTLPAPPVLPAAPRPRRRLALYAGITAVLIAAAVILALVTAA